MTKREFEEDITTWYELIDLCNYENCYICEDVYDGYCVSEAINEGLVDRARNLDWEELRDELNNYPSISCDEYYLPDDNYGWREADCDDFDDYKSDVFVWMDEHNRWDDEEDDEEGNDDDDDDEEIEEYSVSIADMMCIHVDLSVPAPNTENTLNINNLWR